MASRSHDARPIFFPLLSTITLELFAFILPAAWLNSTRISTAPIISLLKGVQ